MSWSGYRTMDPSQIENQFAVEDGISFLGSVFTDPTAEDNQALTRVRVVMESLPPREADFIDLYFFHRLRQTDIAHLFGVSQPTVCYRLQRAADRLKFLFHLPQIDLDTLAKDLGGFLADPLDVQIMLRMVETTCQSEVASQLGVSQGLVRHRFQRTVERMRANRKFQKHVELFDHIAANLNILREVRRVACGDQVIYRIC